MCVCVCVCVDMMDHSVLFLFFYACLLFSSRDREFSLTFQSDSLTQTDCFFVVFLLSLPFSSHFHMIGSAGAATPSGGAAAAGAKGGKKNQNRDGNKSDEKGSYGVLTQRLIQSLLEDSSTGSPDSPLSDAASNGNAEAGGLNGSGQIWKQVSTGNTAQIEKKIRKELQEHGLIELEEPETGSVSSGAAAAAGSAEDDEILRELVRCQNELKMVASTNCSQLKSLLSLVKTDLQRQEIEKKLSEVDEEVIDGYKKLMQAKSKKRNITKKEKESCLKSLKERDELVLQLEGLQTFPFAAEVL